MLQSLDVVVDAAEFGHDLGLQCRQAAGLGRFPWFATATSVIYPGTYRSAGRFSREGPEARARLPET